MAHLRARLTVFIRFIRPHPHPPPGTLAALPPHHAGPLLGPQTTFITDVTVQRHGSASAVSAITDQLRHVHVLRTIQRHILHPSLHSLDQRHGRGRAEARVQSQLVAVQATQHRTWVSPDGEKADPLRGQAGARRLGRRGPPGLETSKALEADLFFLELNS